MTRAFDWAAGQLSWTEHAGRKSAEDGKNWDEELVMQLRACLTNGSIPFCSRFCLAA